MYHRSMNAFCRVIHVHYMHTIHVHDIHTIHIHHIHIIHTHIRAYIHTYKHFNAFLSLCTLTIHGHLSSPLHTCVSVGGCLVVGVYVRACCTNFFIK